MTKQDIFIDRVKTLAIEGWKIGKILPSVTIAQACLESKWGESELATNAHNLFGIKAKKDWKGESYTVRTAEYDKDNKQFFINAPFRKYNSWDESLLDHAKFFHTPDWREENYKGVIGETDYKESCRALQSSGYATSQDYANMLIELIEKYKLYEYDKGINDLSPTLPHSTEKENYDLVTYSNEIDEIPARMITKNLYIPSLSVDLYNTVKDKYKKVLHIGGSNAPSNVTKIIAGKDRDETIDLVQQFIKENRK